MSWLEALFCIPYVRIYLGHDGIGHLAPDEPQNSRIECHSQTTPDEPNLRMLSYGFLTIGIERKDTFGYFRGR